MYGVICINFVDHFLNQGIPAEHKSAETPIGNESGVDYVSKWVEAIPCKHNDHSVVLKFLKENIFSRFGVPKAIISDGGTHFCKAL